MVTINNMFITGGQFIAAVIDGIFSPYKRNGWRYRYICTIIILLNYILHYRIRCSLVSCTVTGYFEEEMKNFKFT